MHVGPETQMQALLVDVALYRYAPCEVWKLVFPFLQQTNFIVVAKMVCREWCKWGSAVEACLIKHVKIMYPSICGNMQYCRAEKIRELFPADSYSRVQSLKLTGWNEDLEGIVWKRYSISGKRKLRNLLSYDRAIECSGLIRCAQCGYIQPPSTQNSTTCVDCVVAHMCSVCFRHRCKQSFGRCFSCVASGRFFTEPTFRLVLA